MKRIFFIIGLVFILSATAQTTRKYSNEFLNIGVDARAFAMGNTVTSTTNDVTSSYWNPAGLVGVTGYEGALMHAAYFANIAQYDYVGFAMPLQNNTVLGVSFMRFGVDDILDTTQLIDNQGNINFNNIHLFSAADYALQLSLARKDIFKGFDLGVTTKIIHRRIGDFATSYGFGFDAGIQKQVDDWHYGIMVRDITTTFNVWNINEEKFSQIQDAIPGENQELPSTTELSIPKAQLGVAKDWRINTAISLQTAFDLNMRFVQTNAILNSSFASIEPAFGFEAKYHDLVFLRGGVNNLQNELNFDGSNSISWQPNIGVGFKYRGIAVDYAMTNIASVGNALYSNIFSVKVDIDALRPKQP